MREEEARRLSRLREELARRNFAREICAYVDAQVEVLAAKRCSPNPSPTSGNREGGDSSKM